VDTAAARSSARTGGCCSPHSRRHLIWGISNPGETLQREQPNYIGLLVSARLGLVTAENQTPESNGCSRHLHLTTAGGRCVGRRPIGVSMTAVLRSRPRMPLQVLQRPNWHGTPVELGGLFRLTKNRREAKAALFTHQLGWEVRLLVGSQLEVVQTQVCRDQEEVLRTGEQWKAAMIEKGWE
jgi:hypothetical protein